MKNYHQEIIVNPAKRLLKELKKTERRNKMKSSLVMILIIGIISFVIGLTVTGLVLAFKYSVILGIIVLFLEPSPFIIGFMFLFGINLAKILQTWIHFPL